MLGALDLIIVAFLVFFIVMFSIGKGDVLMRLFSSGQADDLNKLYDRRKMDRASLLLCIVLLLSELSLIFIAPRVRAVSIIGIVVSIVAFVAYILYLQKIRQDQN
jgi:hypothetical protein